MKLRNFLSRPRRALFIIGIAMTLAIALIQLFKGSQTVEPKSPEHTVLSNTARSRSVGLGLQLDTTITAKRGSVKNGSVVTSVQSATAVKSSSVGPAARPAVAVRSTDTVVKGSSTRSTTAVNQRPGTAVPGTRSTTAVKSTSVSSGVQSTDTVKRSSVWPFAPSTSAVKSRLVTVVPNGRSTTTVGSASVGHKSKTRDSVKNRSFVTLDKSTSFKRKDIHSQSQGPKVLILSLMHNSEKIIPVFKKLVKQLTYPHSLISIGIGEDSSTDNTIELAISMVHEFKDEFRRAQFHHFSELSESHRHWHVDKAPQAKHGLEIQFVRRRHIALARNMLVFSSLEDEDYVMWLDSDIEETPPNIIESLLAAKKDIVVPICLIGSRTKPALYDWNTWKETRESLKYINDIKPKYLFLESYGQKRPDRLLADKFMSEDLVEVDGVGGCLILVKAIHVRQGLTFPTFIFRNQIETEGFSRMAQAMGLKLWLMPRLRIFHACNVESWGNGCK